MANKIVIKDGTISGVYDDRLMPLYISLGIPTIQRASEVEFEDDKWVARAVETGTIISSGISRDKCIKEEVAYLEDRL